MFDFGGGTLDISVLKVKNGTIEVMSTRGDTHLGGQDIDILIMKHCISEFKASKGIDL